MQLLTLALQPTKNMIECQPALPGGSDVPTSHAAHTTEALHLHRRVPRNIIAPLGKPE